MALTTRNLLGRTSNRLKLLAAQLRSNDGYVRRSVEGFEMLLDLKDSGISRELIIGRRRELGFRRLFMSEIQPNMVGFDVGANIGLYALLASSIIGDGGALHAFEPLPANIDNLRMNLELNKCSNVIVHPFAISDDEGLAELSVGSSHNTGSLADDGRLTLSSGQRTYRKQMDLITVEKRRLDNIAAELGVREAHFIRIDIEGYEIFATRSMEQLLTSSPSVKLFVEVHNMMFEDVELTVSPWLNELFCYGLMPRAVVNGDDIIHVTDCEEFRRLLCSFKRSCPHIYMAKP